MPLRVLFVLLLSSGNLEVLFLQLSCMCSQGACSLGRIKHVRPEINKSHLWMHTDFSIILISAHLAYMCFSDAGYSPTGILHLLVAQGIEVTTEQVASHLEV